MTQALQYALLVGFGFLPSLFWLFIYLRNDIDPEPRYMLTRTFFMGLVVALLAVVGQWLLSKILLELNPALQINTSNIFFFGAAFIEEVVKLLAVKAIVLNDPEFDEPLDAMIYMIVAALGFAAIENILVLVQSIPNGFSGTFGIWFYRFVGATFLHALSAAVTGYFLGLAWFYHRHSGKLIVAGLLIASFVHFIFNNIVLRSELRSTVFLHSSVYLLLVAGAIATLFHNLAKKETSEPAVDSSL